MGHGRSSPEYQRESANYGWAVVAIAVLTIVIFIADGMSERRYVSDLRRGGTPSPTVLASPTG
jgi:hypothetical protein